MTDTPQSGKPSKFAEQNKHTEERKATHATEPAEDTPDKITEVPADPATSQKQA